MFYVDTLGSYKSSDYREDVWKEIANELKADASEKRTHVPSENKNDIDDKLINLITKDVDIDEQFLLSHLPALKQLITNEEIKFKFKNGYQEFWLQKPIMKLYPSLWSIVQRFLIAFPSSYLSERGFSAVATLLTKKRNRLLVTERGDLRLFLSKFEPPINKLVNAHQVHPSH
ncbi:uncharacterized protein LOC112684046 [Sipha flava]|uniref:Uncharacterized protein LOC112684046 n=1 Tax=Sipha flava TaxID=143950 RepID=A0A8B8FLB1_9HEMI|nr:uncharacterized protein LOC112684046 [Sipha flava]